MALNGIYWDRKFKWGRKADTKQIMLAERVDADTDDICDEGLSKALTQTMYHGKPEKSMNFDNHKITNLKKPTNINDVATLSNLRMSNYYEDVSTTANVIVINVPYSYYSSDIPRMNGMRFFYSLQ
ncbi:hypothetical protein AGMMS49593_08360 [Endomicrobiia bacterium]|nr:hypothetical protein AGMMS49593_08360 [Endomicrobiia bacterium]